MNTKPASVSPASVKAAPMSTAKGPSTMLNARPDSTLQTLGWSQLSGTASQISASADGTIWVLSDQPAGNDKYIYHYKAGVWTNVGGQASQIAAARDGTLYVINSGGGTYHYTYGSVNAAWVALGGGAESITVAADGSVYVVSNAGAGADHAIWKNTNNTWTQMSGAAKSLYTSLDWGTYSDGGTISPGGIYVLNAAGQIYYLNTSGTYAALSGSASALAATTAGGLFALGTPASSSGSQLYYLDLSSGTWTAPPGSGISLSSDGVSLYVVNSVGAMYKTAATPAVSPAPSATLPPFQVKKGGVVEAWGPWDTATNFHFPVQSGYNGSGSTVAIVIDAVPAQSDMTAYLSKFGVNRTGQISSRPVDGGGAIDDANGGEASLDAETIAGLSPGANVIVYNIPDLADNHIDDALNAIISDGRANVVSMSFGGCEYSNSKFVDHPIFNTMNSLGIAIVASSGDSGNACYYDGNTWPAAAESPASDPNITSVGGSATDPGATGEVLPVMWNDCASTQSSIGDNCESGGGLSGYFATPSYQVGLSGADQTSRNVPDITLPGNNAYIRLGGSGYLIGGTSWSAPMAGALLAQIYQYCNTTSIPNAVRMWYNTYNTLGYAAFTDITSGNNAYFTTTTPSYTAVAGYDNVGGIGQPFGMSVAQNTCPGHVLSPLAGSMTSASTMVAALPATARVVDNVKPYGHMPGVIDQGVRAGSETNRIGILLRVTPTLHQDERSVVDALTTAGFHIDQRFPNAMLIDVTAPTSTMSRYFGTTFHTFSQDGHGTRFGNTAPLVIPASIAPYVQGIVSDNLITKHYGPLHMKPLPF